MTLPEDLINEILYFVPLKSVCRFKCVCKSWNSIIKNQNMSYLVIRDGNKCATSKLVTSLVRYDHNHNLKSRCNLQLKLPPCCPRSFRSYRDDDVRVVGPCNGLVCISTLGCSDMEIISWNPSTRKSITLHPSFPPSPSIPPAFGFGFDSNANDYKVVKFRQCLHEEYAFNVHVYSMAKNSWRTNVSSKYLETMFQDDDEYESTIDVSSWVAVVFNKYCCWLTRRLVGGDSILSFDMSREVFVKTLLPLDAFQPEQQTSQILPLRDSLALIVGSYSSEGSTFQIWTIRDLNAEGSWTKRAAIGPILGRYRSLAFWRNYDSLILEDLKCKGLMSYDLRLHKTKELGINVASLRFHMVFDYTETSVSVAMPTRYPTGSQCKRIPIFAYLSRIVKLQEEEDMLEETKSKLMDRLAETNSKLKELHLYLRRAEKSLTESISKDLIKFTRLTEDRNNPTYNLIKRLYSYNRRLIE